MCYLLLGAAIATLFAVAMWYAFVLPVPELSGIGVITNKSFQAARTIQRYQAGPRREVWSQDNIAIPESYFFDIRVEGLPTKVQYSMPALEAENYNVGQKVLIRYEERVIPLIWKRIQVTEMTPVDTGPAP